MSFGWLDNDHVTVPVFNMRLQVNTFIYAFLTVVWRLITGLAVSAALWAFAQALHMVANTEAYARGTYSLTRKRPAAADSSIDKNRPLAAPPLPVFDNREPTPDDLQYSPPLRHRLQQRMPTSPVRRVTVLRDRAEHEERPPRPVGTWEVVDSLDGKPSALPFDTV